MTEKEKNLYESLRNTAACLTQIIEERDTFRECWHETCKKLQELQKTNEELYAENVRLEYGFDCAIDDAYKRGFEDGKEIARDELIATIQGYTEGRTKK